ncbi:oligosaccharide flippase family protein [Crocinitomicaceae bacterium]|nr:oligosaccharide flippase family protein [Crocinitomicaceae bacterium]
MQKKFISNLALMVLLNLLVKPVAIFGIDANVQDLVGEDYGTYFALLNFSFLFNILLDFGINNFTTKNVAQHPHMASKYLGKVLGFRFMLFLLYAVVSFTIALVLQWKSYELFLLSFLVFNQFLITLIAYTRSYFGGALMFKTDAIISILDRFLLIIFCGILLLLPSTNKDFQIEWFIWIQTGCYLITLLIAVTLLFTKFGIPKLKVQPAFSYSIVRQSFPYALLIFLMMIYTRIDSVMVERLHSHGKEEAGYYAMGFRLINAFFMFAMIFSNLLLPIFSRMFQKVEDVRPLLKTSAKLLVGGAILLSIVSYFNGEYILSLIYKNNVSESYEAFQLLMFSFIGMCATILYGTLLTARGNMRFLNSISAIGIVINITMNVFLIPDYGAKGAAVATVITQSLISAIQFVYSVRVIKVPFPVKEVILFVLYVGGLLGICYFLRADSLMTFFAILAASFASMFVFRIIDLKNLFRIFKGEV